MIAGNYCDIFVYSLQTGQLEQSFLNKNITITVTSMDDKTIYIANNPKDGVITGYSLESKEPQLKYASDSNNLSINVLKISPDGQTLVAGYSDGTIRLWDRRTGELSLNLQRRDKKIITDAWLTPDHKHLVSSAHRGESIEVWRLHVNQNKLFAVIRNFGAMAITPCTGGEFETDEDFDNQH